MGEKCRHREVVHTEGKKGQEYMMLEEVGQWKVVYHEGQCRD
jgi:hypothetical protein